MLNRKTALAWILVVCLALAGCGAQTPTDAASQSEDISAEHTESNPSSAEESLFDPADTAEAAEPSPEESLSDPEPELTAPQDVVIPDPELTVEEVAAMEAGSVLPQEHLPQELDDFFYAEALSDSVFQRMNGTSYRDGCPVSPEELRYVRVLHRGFDGETHIGELVCNKSIAEDVVSIFRQLYEADYPIEKMLLVDEYGGDDELSMEDNNTSCFNYRPVSGTSTLSRHAYGLALDINPLYNPYITSHGFEPANAGDYVDRSKDTPYQITSEDACYRLMDERGFAWGGWWHNVKDYQHFEK